MCSGGRHIRTSRIFLALRLSLQTHCQVNFRTLDYHGEDLLMILFRPLMATVCHIL